MKLLHATYLMIVFLSEPFSNKTWLLTWNKSGDNPLLKFYVKHTVKKKWKEKKKRKENRKKNQQGEWLYSHHFSNHRTQHIWLILSGYMKNLALQNIMYINYFQSMYHNFSVCWHFLISKKTWRCRTTGAISPRFRVKTGCFAVRLRSAQQTHEPDTQLAAVLRANNLSPSQIPTLGISLIQSINSLFS